MAKAPRIADIKSRADGLTAEFCTKMERATLRIVETADGAARFLNSLGRGGPLPIAAALGEDLRTCEHVRLRTIIRLYQ